MTHLIKNKLLTCAVICLPGLSLMDCRAEAAAPQSDRAVESTITPYEQELIAKCRGVALAKLQRLMPDCELTEQDIVAVAIDNRWYNPSKYIWYQSAVECSDLPVDNPRTVMIQYYRGRCY